MSTFLAERTPVTTLPGEPVPYVIEAGSGRARALLGEVAHALEGAEESGGAMSVMALDGPKAERPIPLHYHDREFEFFYGLRGGEIRSYTDQRQEQKDAARPYHRNPHFRRRAHSAARSATITPNDHALCHRSRTWGGCRCARPARSASPTSVA